MKWTSGGVPTDPLHTSGCQNWLGAHETGLLAVSNEYSSDKRALTSIILEVAVKPAKKSNEVKVDDCKTAQSE